jgi:hypothetical protein
MVEPGILIGLKENAQDMRMSPRPPGGGFRMGVPLSERWTLAGWSGEGWSAIRRPMERCKP